jgi:hypothetical protein
MVIDTEHALIGGLEDEPMLLLGCEMLAQPAIGPTPPEHTRAKYDDQRHGQLSARRQDRALATFGVRFGLLPLRNPALRQPGSCGRRRPAVRTRSFATRFTAGPAQQRQQGRR